MLYQDCTPVSYSTSSLYLVPHCSLHSEIALFFDSAEKDLANAIEMYYLYGLSNLKLEIHIVIDTLSFDILDLNI